MTPATLKGNSLYADLEALFERAKDGRKYGLNALPEERVANLLVELLADALVRTEAEIEAICGAGFVTLFDGVSVKQQASAIRRSQKAVA